MMIKNYFILGLVLFSTHLFAQISIDFPKERQVFQRQNFDANNNFQGDGMIRISGTFTGEYDSIMAKVEPRVIGQGTATSWQKINTRNGKPYFKGTLYAKGGWYRLSVIAFKDGAEVGNDVVRRVGIGEVFIIAGQSNAQGGGEAYGLSGLPAVDDRISSVDFDNGPIEDNKLVIGFSKPDKDSSSLGPFHYVPWSWTRLGDLLTNRLNVPVLFYGAGHGGTEIKHWEDASQGRITPDIPTWLFMDKGAPYKALGATLEFYASLTGVRAVLWHQGESDHDVPANVYQKSLETVIAKSREDIENQNLAWMVARASYAGGSTSVSTLKGQQQTIDADANVFNGPNTDVITGTSNRIDLTHMTTAKGMAAHANVWFESMTDNNLAFFRKASSIPAKDFIDLDCTCNLGNSFNPVTLSPTSSYQGYAWSVRDNTLSESMGVSTSSCCSFRNTVPADYQKFNWQYDSTRSINANFGKYALNVRKPTSNLVMFSPIVRINSFTYPANPYFSGSASKDITLFLDETGNASLTISDLGGNSFINCEVKLSLSQTSFSAEDLGEQTVVYTAVSKNSSSRSVDLKVTVVDNINPTLRVKSIASSLDAQGVLTVGSEDIIVEAFDNDAIAETLLSETVFSCSNIGENKISVTVKDASGNEITQEAVLTISDGQGVCLCSYIILASESVSISGSNILSGGIGTTSSNKTITLAESTFGSNVFVKSDNLVNDSKSKPTLILKGVALSAPAFEWNTFDDKINIKVKATETAAQNHFKKVVVSKSSKLTFKGNEDIYIQKLKMKKGSTLNVEGNTKIHIVKPPKFWADIKINSGLQSLEIFSEGKVVIKGNSTVNANIHTKSSIEILNASGKPTNINGLFTGTVIKVGENVKWGGSNNDCNDNLNNNGARFREEEAEIAVSIETPIEHLLKAEDEQSLLSYGPNPSKGDFSLFFNPANLGEKKEKVIIKVFDVSGRNVFKARKEINLAQNTIRLDLRGLNTGGYFMQVKVSSKVEVIRLVIE